MTFPFIISLDPKTRFPMLEMPDQNFAITWLPVTKIQIEYFLSETMDSRFDRTWYNRRLKDNARVSWRTLNARNFSQAFITGMTFDEVQALSRWWGDRFDIPTIAEWQAALHIFDQVVAQENFINEIVATTDIHPRAGRLIRQLENTLVNNRLQLKSLERKLSHQMLMRSGILEYAYENAQRNSCAACGQPDSVLRASRARGEDLAQDQPTKLRHPDIGERMGSLGFRLIVRRN
jgi:hypothetical protein